MALPDWVVISGIIASAAGSVTLWIKAKPEARKLDRDGNAAILTAGATMLNASAGGAADLWRRIEALEAWRANTERRVARHDRWHSRWDHTLAGLANAQGIDLPPPPPLRDDDDTAA